MRKSKNKSKFKLGTHIINHIQNNFKQYFIVTILFLIGIFLGVFCINTIEQEQRQEITLYLSDSIQTLKEHGTTEQKSLLFNTIKGNVILGVALWFAGTTIIGIPIVFGILVFRGFCLGYTIATCIATLGIGKGLGFILITLLLQNILLIPAILALAVSGMKLYQSIMKDKRKENIKIEIIRHTAFSTIMLLFCIASAIVEVQVSGFLLNNFVKYF